METFNNVKLILDKLKVRYLNSASVIIESNNTKILCDPWLVNGEFYNSWGIYPPFNFEPKEYDDIDYIYISHIHPDHCSTLTLSKLNKDIPVIIFNFFDKSLKNKIESLGFTVTELSNNLRTKLNNDFFINIFLADNCNPEICTKAFGCGQFESEFRATPIDTMAIFDDGKQVIVNTNDCPPELSLKTLPVVKEIYKKIDFLLVGYLGASSYPQSYNFSKDYLDKEKSKKIQNRLNAGKEYVDLIKPKYFMPFAGQYTLTGKNSFLNSDRGEPELDDAYEFYKKEFSSSEQICIILNQNETFDLDNPFIPNYKKIDIDKKQKYINEIFSQFKYDYEMEKEPSLSKLKKYIPKSFERFEKRRKEIGFYSDTVVLLKLNEKAYVKIFSNGKGFEYSEYKSINNSEKFLEISCDSRLLKNLLQGPKRANWNVASLGSHLSYRRIPNIHDRGLNYCWNWFYSEIYDD